MVRIVQDTYQQVDDRTFTDGFRTLLGRFRQFKIVRTLQPVVLVGRNPTTDNQALDPIINTSGQLVMQLAAGVVPPTAAFAPDQSNWAATPEATISGAGNGSIALATPTPLGGTLPVFSIEGILYSYICDATVATRTTAPPLLLTGITRVLGTQSDLSLVDTLSLTQNQEGSVYASGNGVRVKNQNGTFTFTAGGSPCAFKVRAFSGSVAAATNGVAGDTHRLTVFLRQVA